MNTIERGTDEHLMAQAKGVMFQYRPFIKDPNFPLDEVLGMVTKPLFNSYKREEELKGVLKQANAYFDAGYPDQAEELIKNTLKIKTV